MLIILDRDGVINHDSKDYIKSPEEWIPLPGSLEAIAQLNKAGHKVVVATNQSGVGRGYYSLQMMHKIHEHMQRSVVSVGGHLDGIYYCPHTPDDHCGCRKPKPGMLLNIAEQHPGNFDEALLVGDSLRDLQAAQAVNIKSALVKTGNGANLFEKGGGPKDVMAFDDLSAAAQWILQNNK